MLAPAAIFSLATLLTAASGSLVPRQSVTPPPECDVIPKWEVTNFQWFNSSHNLDCVNPVNVPNVCYNSTPNGLVGCDGNLDHCDGCGVNGCYTGLPLQPAGYGPPDKIHLSIPSVQGYEDCGETNPQSIRRYDVGNGILMCAGVAYHISFFGNSNEATSIGHIDFAPIQSWTCSNGSQITGAGSIDFEMSCTRDAQNNATCVVPEGESVVIPLLAYEIN